MARDTSAAIVLTGMSRVRGSWQCSDPLLIDDLSNGVRYSHQSGLHKTRAPNGGITLRAFNRQFRMADACCPPCLAGRWTGGLLADLVHLRLLRAPSGSEPKNRLARTRKFCRHSGERANVEASFAVLWAN